MKLETSIKPRRDGTVNVTLDKSTYVFTEEDGRLVADVENESHVGHLIALGNFYPADEADYPAGLLAAKTIAGNDDGEDGAGEDDEDELPLGGLPVEANTPPSKTVRKAKG